MQTNPDLAELLADELAFRGVSYSIEREPPPIRLVAPGRDPVEITHDGGGLVIALPGCRLSVDMLPVSTIANLILPLHRGCADDPEPDADQDLYAGTSAKMSKANSGVLPDGANPYKLAEAMGSPNLFRRAKAEARRWFTDDPTLLEQAEACAEAAVMRTIYYFNGWGKLEWLAFGKNGFVTLALLAFKGSLYKTKKGKRTDKRKPHTRTNYHSEKCDENGDPLPDVFDFAPENGGCHSAYRPQTSPEDSELVEKILAALPAPDAEILRRYHMEGESSEDIARSLNCSVRTVQRSLRSSRDFLREKFSEFVSPNSDISR